MARTRFAPDLGLTVRMTTVLFVLGALFVALIVTLMYLAGSSGYGGLVPLIGIAGLGVAFYQWWSSDKVAMRAMRAREVTPEEEPELHGMIDRLCALADMPKPRVGVADLDIPNAFATGRSPKRSVVCVTTGIRNKLTPQEMEAVLAHELSHVAHRDVLVMTLASSAGIVAGMLTRSAQFGGFAMSRSRNNNNGGGAPAYLIALVVSLVVYAVTFFLTRLLSRYRELCADRAGAYLTLQPGALASALQKISGDMGSIPTRDLRAAQPMNAFFFAPAVRPSFKSMFATHPSLEKRLEQLAKIQADLSRPTQ